MLRIAALLVLVVGVGVVRPASAEVPHAPNMVLLYYGFDPNGPRNWTPEVLKHYVAYHADRGTEAERPVDTFFDTVLWMSRKSSRGALFETSAKSVPTKEIDWRESMDRLYEPGLQLNALEAAAAEVEAKLKRPVKVWVVLTLPYPDVRIDNWAELDGSPKWDFRTSDKPRLEALQWFVRSSVERWQKAGFEHLQLLGFYWFNEGHVNLRKREDVQDKALLTDLRLMGETARFVHSVKIGGRPLTLSWIPYSPYGGDRLEVTAGLMKVEPESRFDYLMVQPNYFFTNWKKEKKDLVELVGNVSKIGAGVEIEFSGSLARDAAAKQRFFDYLEVIPREHPRWSEVPAGYYEGLRAVYDMATRPELADCYDALYEFVKNRRNGK